MEPGGDDGFAVVRIIDDCRSPPAEWDLIRLSVPIGCTRCASCCCSWRGAAELVGSWLCEAPPICRNGSVLPPRRQVKVAATKPRVNVVTFALVIRAGRVLTKVNGSPGDSEGSTVADKLTGRCYV